MSTQLEALVYFFRLEERLAASNQELQRLRDPEQVEGNPEVAKLSFHLSQNNKMTLKFFHWFMISL